MATEGQPYKAQFRDSSIPPENLLGTDAIEASEQALKKAIYDSNEILVTASTVATLQRVSLTLYRSKLVGEKKSPLGTIDVMSVRIEDVLNVNAIIGPIFGSIKITTKFTALNKPYNIGLFWRKDAVKMKRISQGYVIALQRNIDLQSMPTEELRTILHELGTDDHTVK